MDQSITCGQNTTGMLKCGRGRGGSKVGLKVGSMIGGGFYFVTGNEADSWRGVACSLSHSIPNITEPPP